MRRYVFPIFFSAIVLMAVIFVSCDEPIELDPEQTPPLVVIEAQVTNKPGYQYVKVSRSTPFYHIGPTPRITDAQVSVADDEGEVHTFVHNPRNHPDSSGYYLPAVPFTGGIGRTYSLTVQAGDNVYEASDRMTRVTTIDSVSFRLNENQQEDPKEPGKIYELLVYAREPQDEENYYLFRYYRNDTLVVFNPNDIYYSNDDLLGENIDGIPSPVFYGENDTARLEVYSLSRRGYIFYNDLFSLLNNDAGGMFGPIPSSPRTNLSNGALGFFQVSAIEEAQASMK